jgi:hypothetical protein
MTLKLAHFSVDLAPKGLPTTTSARQRSFMFLKNFFFSMLSRANGLFGSLKNRISLIALKRLSDRNDVLLKELEGFLKWSRVKQNNSLRLKFEYSIAGEDYLTVCISEKIVDERVLTFSSPGAQMCKQTPLVKGLFAIKGIEQVILHPYEIFFIKSKVYTWEELNPQIERVVLEHLGK